MEPSPKLRTIIICTLFPTSPRPPSGLKMIAVIQNFAKIRMTLRILWGRDVGVRIATTCLRNLVNIGEKYSLLPYICNSNMNVMRKIRIHARIAWFMCMRIPYVCMELKRDLLKKSDNLMNINVTVIKICIYRKVCTFFSWNDTTVWFDCNFFSGFSKTMTVNSENFFCRILDSEYLDSPDFSPSI